MKDLSLKEVEELEAVFDVKAQEAKPLGRVIGHEEQKKEILSVINWFKDAKALKDKGISAPRGIVLMGPPGCGKSLLIKEIIKYVDLPTFVYEGIDDNVSAGLVNLFNEAKEKGPSIVVIDELDLLINRDARLKRVLQEILDGVESCDNILVLTATNDIDEIPDALLRNGRLEKIIDIPYPTGKENVLLFKYLFSKLAAKLPDDLDYEELAISLHHLSCSSIKAIVNDVMLRNGLTDITVAQIDKSIYTISERVIDNEEENSLEAACHEAAHALVASKFPKHFIVKRLNVSGASGSFEAKEIEKGFWPYDKVIADIKICMAGVIGQKVLFGQGSRGCEDDLDKARINAYNLINLCGYSSCWETLPPVRERNRMETPLKRRRMERKIEKLLRKCEKETYKIVNDNKDTILKLGKLLYEKNHLKYSEILSVLNSK